MTLEFDAARALFQRLDDNLNQVIRDRRPAIRLLLAALAGGGHVLLEDVPGTGKTTLAKALAKSLRGRFKRIQFTPDLLPTDILGVSIYDQSTQCFRFQPGPVFSQVLLADEINRASPRTQSALLEAMGEGQVSVDGELKTLDEAFFVIATQNPLEQSGTYPLPESQLDRFLMRISIGYPDRKAERRLLETGNRKTVIEEIEPVLDTQQVMDIREQIAAVHVSETFYDYMQDVLEFTRSSIHFTHGLSPRAGLALLHTTRSWAFLAGRDHVIPEDLQAIFPFVASHRLQSRETMGEYSFQQLKELLMEVPVP